MAARTTTRKPATPAGVPSYRKPLTLLERLSSGQRWTVKRENGVPVRLMRWDGKRVNPSCSVSLRLAAGTGGAQKAIWEAALTLEALAAEAPRLVSLLSGQAGADGKSVADWLRAISDARHERDTWKRLAEEAKQQLVESERVSNARLSELRGIARDMETLITALNTDPFYKAMDQPQNGGYPGGNLHACAAIVLEQYADQNSRLISERNCEAGRASNFSDQLDEALIDRDELRAELASLRTIVMNALRIEPERQADYPLLEGAETLVAAYLERGLQAGDLRESLRNRNEQITALVKERDEALTVNRGLSTALESEQATNRAHQHARKMGWLMSIGALLLSIPLTLWISGFWSWRAGR